MLLNSIFSVKFFSLFLSLILVLLFLQNCLGEEVTLYDKYNRRVNINVPTKRACLLATYELIPALKISSQVVCLGKWAYESPILKQTIPNLNKIPTPGVGGPGLNVELLKKLNVDLVITFRVPIEELEYLESKGIKTYAIYPENLEELIEVIKVHGILFKKEQELNNLLKEMNSIIELTQKKINKIPLNKRKKVIWLHSEPTTISGGTGIVNDTINKIGGINPAANLFSNINITKVSLETIIKLDPDVIFIWGAAPFSPESLLQNPQWQSIKAIKNRKVFKLATLTTFSPKHPLDILYMAMKVYPERFSDINFEQIADEFYKKIFGIPYSNYK